MGFSYRLVAAFAIVTSAGCFSGVFGNDFKRCTLTSDCSHGLVCVFGACEPKCGRDQDCPASARCLLTSDGAACVTQQAAACAHGCPPGTVCGSDGTCRTVCDGMLLPCLIGQACKGSSCVGSDTTHDPAAGVAAVGGAGGLGVGGDGTAFGGLGGTTQGTQGMGGDGGSGAGGDTGPGAGGGAGAAGTANAGAGGSAPTTCAEVHNLAGCCTSDANWWCDPTTLQLNHETCTNCGWDTRSSYGCKGQGADPSGDVPIQCGVSGQCQAQGATCNSCCQNAHGTNAAVEASTVLANCGCNPACASECATSCGGTPTQACVRCAATKIAAGVCPGCTTTACDAALGCLFSCP